MGEVVRDPSRGFECPRCGRPVTYKGRGRRPVWCSARCRVEASIERRGNRVVGVEPRVVTVVPPKQRVSEWEQNERRRIQETLTRGTFAAMVADDPFLLSRVLGRPRRVHEAEPSPSAEPSPGISEGRLRTSLLRLPFSPDRTPGRRGAHDGSVAQWSGPCCSTSSRNSSATASSTSGTCP
jgi:hypothetical protein